MPRGIRAVLLGFGVIQLSGCGVSLSEILDSAASVEAPEVLLPRLTAISVANLDASMEWYRHVLGFEHELLPSAPVNGTRVAILRHGDYELELIEMAGSAAADPPDPSNPASRRGLVKLAFHTPDIDAFDRWATLASARYQSTLRESNRTGGRFFILLDPDGNWVQIFGPAA